MTRDQVLGIVRAVAAPMLAFAAAKGWVTDNQTGELIVTALGAVLTAVWSVLSKKQ